MRLASGGLHMKSQGQKISSSLFLVRLWQSESDDAQADWTGRVIHVASGEASNFLDLSTLAPLLLELLNTRPASQRRLVDGSELQKHTKRRRQ
jgi:hypothetical protein